MDVLKIQINYYYTALKGRWKPCGRRHTHKNGQRKLCMDKENCVFSLSWTVQKLKDFEWNSSSTLIAETGRIEELQFGAGRNDFQDGKY